MLEKIIAAVVAAVLKYAFQDHIWALWGIRYGQKSWTKLGTGSMAELKAYEPTLFGEGWRTEILGAGITPPGPPEAQPPQELPKDPEKKS